MHYLQESKNMAIIKIYFTDESSSLDVLDSRVTINQKMQNFT